ncbi:MAG: toprim domain-containing protein [Actinobacteria bacterium]|nr:toprim domain-containing protein [Actinomycetota bacterium]
MHDLATDIGRMRGEDYSAIAKEAFKDDLASISDYEDTPDVKVLPDPLDEAIYGDIYDSVSMWPEALAYLEDRGISRHTAMQLGLMYDEEDQRVVFPVYDRKGRLYGFTGRSILDPEDYSSQRYPKVKDYLGLPKQHLLLGEERCVKGKPMLVVEGLMAYARLHEIGAAEQFNVVALLGSELTDKKAERLLRWNEAVWLLPDDDEAGDVCLWGRLTDAGHHKGGGAIDKLYDHVPIYVPEYPEEVGDVDDFERADIDRIKNDTEPYICS